MPPQLWEDRGKPPSSVLGWNRVECRVRTWCLEGDPWGEGVGVRVHWPGLLLCREQIQASMKCAESWRSSLALQAFPAEIPGPPSSPWSSEVFGFLISSTSTWDRATLGPGFRQELQAKRQTLLCREKGGCRKHPLTSQSWDGPVRARKKGRREVGAAVSP